MRARWLAVAVALAVSLPSLGIGLMLDDHIQRAMADGYFPTRTLDYFTFARSPEQVEQWRRHGPFPWFTASDLRLSFFRPLSSALFLFDHTLFRDTVWVQHAHSILWLLGLVFAAGALFRRVLTPAAASLAVVLFALDEAHGLPVGWLANRNALVATLPVLLGLVAYVRFRQSGWAPGRWLAALGLAIGLLGGEGALATAAYFVSYELFSRDPISHRLRAIAPVVLVVVAWAIVYRSLGYGANGSGGYLDPGVSPLRFVQEAPFRFLSLMAPLTLGLSSDLAFVAPRLRLPVIAGGAIGLTLVLLALRSAWRLLADEDRSAIRWLGVGAVFGLAPSLAVLPLDRLTVGASIGAAAVVAILLRAAWEQKRRAVLVWLVAVHLALPPIAWFGGPLTLGWWVRAGENAILEPPPAQFTGRVVLINAPDPSSGVYGSLFLRALGRPRPERWWVLSMSPHPHRLHRVGERALELEVLEGPMLDTYYETLVRDPKAAPHKPGDAVALDGATITVLAVDAGRPTRIRADFELPLADHRLLVWRTNTFVQIPAPELGAALELPASRSLLEQAFTSRSSPAF